VHVFSPIYAFGFYYSLGYVPWSWVCLRTPRNWLLFRALWRYTCLMCWWFASLVSFDIIGRPSHYCVVLLFKGSFELITLCQPFFNCLDRSCWPFSKSSCLHFTSNACLLIPVWKDSSLPSHWWVFSYQLQHIALGDRPLQRLNRCSIVSLTDLHNEHLEDPMYPFLKRRSHVKVLLIISERRVETFGHRSWFHTFPQIFVLSRGSCLSASW